jgi:hypothetical protein
MLKKIFGLSFIVMVFSFTNVTAQDSYTNSTFNFNCNCTKLKIPQEINQNKTVNFYSHKDYNTTINITTTKFSLGFDGALQKKQFLQSFLQNQFPKIEVENTSIAGETAVYHQWSEMESKFFKRIYFIHKNQIFDILFQSDTNEKLNLALVEFENNFKLN